MPPVAVHVDGRAATARGGNTPNRRTGASQMRARRRRCARR
jgi:hypothetical protein